MTTGLDTMPLPVPVEAARAYNAAALEAWGEGVWLNPIPDAAKPAA